MTGKVYTGFTNPAILKLIPERPELRILDMGCGGGDNARELQRRGCRVWGITLSTAERELALRACEAVWVCNLDTGLPKEIEGLQFDGILASHLLEHVMDPSRVLRAASAYLAPHGRVYIAIPNMAHWDLRKRFLRGEWGREEFGPMDRTHLHFWSFKTAPEMLKDTGLQLDLHVGGDGKCPWRGISTFSRSVSRSTDIALERRWPNLFAIQTLLVASLAPRKSGEE